MATGGCEKQLRTPVLEEAGCPECGEAVEVFTRRNRLAADCTCDSGYDLHEEQPFFIQLAVRML